MSTQTSAKPWPVGVNTMSFMWRVGARDALETLARAGYTRFEVMAQRPHFDPFMSMDEARTFARFLRDAELTVETINIPSLDQNLASATPEMRKHTVGVFARLVDIAQCIGASGIIVVTGRVNPLIRPPQADLEGWFNGAFENVLRLAEGRGVKLLLENIPMGVYARADQLADYAASLSHPQVSICYDIANAHFIGEDVAAGVERVAPHLGIVHLSDTTRQSWRHDPIGQGDCDFAGFARALTGVGYAGTAMLEIVADPAVEHILESDRRFAALTGT